ncbi:helix-turn-helix domain-containing protein [Aequorivita vladivostokensis]|uniref:helix-turn-helix domain-containing protein n=1 Tax=Aequorivita vladivostokensis TaxID=171194 RepID=UPI0006967E00|nr:helix-turn-helix transcriptional regulator [Aequorivita vladivostokensis]
MKDNDSKAILLELANRIKTLRNERNLTQAVCYEDTGINFGRIERGVRDISFTTLVKICKYFNVSMNELLKDTF